MRRRLVRLLFALGLVVLLVLLAVLLASRTAPVRELVRRQTVRLLAGATGAEVRIGAVTGTLLHAVVLEDLRLAVDGRTVARVPRLEIGYALFPLLRGETCPPSTNTAAPIFSVTGWRSSAEVSTTVRPPIGSPPTSGPTWRRS